ncbi:MAG: MoaD/ThiS family protein [Verrucomicrobia bacterium]|nr:MoaD/ThiS family protein [Verrucomicrobiota bacterium]
MRIRTQFFSYFKELTGCAETTVELPADSTIAALLEQLHVRFPRMKPMQNSTLIAVGVEYQPRDYVLRDGDEVSLFPPVQGG